MNSILGLHHITAIAGDAKRNHDFYTRVLGLRLVKKTVNFDDPGTYHFYYGDETGHAGTILTFFPWQGIGQGTNGTAMATEIGYSVAAGSLEFWKTRFTGMNIAHGEVIEKFGEWVLPFKDPDGLNLQLVVPANEDNRQGWAGSQIAAGHALKGFSGVGLSVQNAAATVSLLTGVLDYKVLEHKDNIYRLGSIASGTANIVDVIELPNQAHGHNAAGTNHHVAFRVKDEDVLMAYREKVLGRGLDITPKINRDYFFSLYFREPGGVLFELATENPGFTVDEPLGELGGHLKLPARYEPSRKKIEASLPAI